MVSRIQNLSSLTYRTFTITNYLFSIHNAFVIEWQQSLWFISPFDILSVFFLGLNNLNILLSANAATCILLLNSDVQILLWHLQLRHLVFKPDFSSSLLCYYTYLHGQEMAPTNGKWCNCKYLLSVLENTTWILTSRGQINIFGSPSYTAVLKGEKRWGREREGILSVFGSEIMCQKS